MYYPKMYIQVKFWHHGTSIATQILARNAIFNKSAFSPIFHNIAMFGMSTSIHKKRTTEMPLQHHLGHSLNSLNKKLSKVSIYSDIFQVS